MTGAATPPADALCVCGDASGEHRMGRKGCKEPGCGCDRFEPTGSFAPELGFTEQRLAETERERDEAVAKVARINDLANESRTVNDALRADLAALRYDFGKLEGAHTLACTSREHNKKRADLAEAELVSARQETASVRNELGAARLKIEQLRAELKQLRVDRVGRLIYAYDAWACLACGSRYHAAYTDHEHGPLTAVTVTIARQGAPTE